MTDTDMTAMRKTIGRLELMISALEERIAWLEMAANARKPEGVVVNTIRMRPVLRSW